MALNGSEKIGALLILALFCGTLIWSWDGNVRPPRVAGDEKANPEARKPAMNEIPRVKSASHLPPRKVIVGTVSRAFRPPYPGVEKRTEELLAIFDRMAAESHKRYGRGLDLAVLPEMAVTGGRGGWEATARERALPFDGALREAFSKKARELRSYLVVPMNLVEADDPETVSNAAILLDREGRVAGIYRKIHLASQQGKEDLEGGTSPGCEAPVFECDFGKLGIQICLDAMFEYGWDELARRGAELVVWPTWRPGTAHATSRALYHRYFIVSATYMTTAHVFEPTGKIVATADPADPLLVQEIDLSNAIVATGGGRVGEGGADMKERFGGRIGFRFYPEEAYGLFWSNDPKTPVAEMLREIGATELEVLLERQRGIYCKAGVVGAEARVEAAHVAGR